MGVVSGIGDYDQEKEKEEEEVDSIVVPAGCKLGVDSDARVELGVMAAVVRWSRGLGGMVGIGGRGFGYWCLEIVGTAGLGLKPGGIEGFLKLGVIVLVCGSVAVGDGGCG